MKRLVLILALVSPAVPDMQCRACCAMLCLLCRVLGDLESLLRTQDMPADHAAAYEFVLRRANVLYACGKNVRSSPRRHP